MDGVDPLGLLIGLALLGLVFAGLEGRFRSGSGPAWFRRPDLRTDLAYWFFTPLVSRGAARAAVALALFAAVWLGGGSLAALREAFAAGRMPDFGWAPLAVRLRALPFAAQLALGLLVADFLSYWMHRAFHRGRLWSFHAVHHSSPRLDWLSSVRLHPVNQAAMRVMQALPLLFLGFEPAVFAVVAPLLTFYAIFLHANVPWRLGPLRFAIATPRFHRWHHTSEVEGMDKNFAGLFPLFDLLFGTYWMPEQAPERFGAGDECVPAGLWPQLLHPFRSRARQRARPGPLAADVV